jgi:hypothetical protein
MTFINVQNTTNRATIVPARGGFGVVLAPGDKATVCPEGESGQGRFWNMLSSGVIAERGRRRSRVLRFIQHHAGNYNEAA